MESKYLKYKNKYFKLKYQNGGNEYTTTIENIIKLLMEKLENCKDDIIKIDSLDLSFQVLGQLIMLKYEDKLEYNNYTFKKENDEIIVSQNTKLIKTLLLTDIKNLYNEKTKECSNIKLNSNYTLNFSQINQLINNLSANFNDNNITFVRNNNDITIRG